MDVIKKEGASTCCPINTLPENNAYMFQNALLSDITFTFPKEGNKKIEAHKYIIATGSFYFFTLLSGNWKETKQIEINNVSSNAFNELLKYLYTDIIRITPNIGVELLQCSKYYGIPRLEEECNTFFKENFNAETVLLIFENINFFDTEHAMVLNEMCVNMMKYNIKDVLDTEQFLNIQLSTLERILKIQDLVCEEYILFKEILKWATRACEKNNIPLCGLSKRKALGHCANLIRFPAMTAEEFAGCIEIYDSFLTKEEAHDIFVYITFKNLDAIKISFPTVPRYMFETNFYVLKRFIKPSIDSSNKLYRGFDEIKISRKTPSTCIHGIGIYGKTKESISMETVTVKLKSENKLIHEVVHYVVYDGSTAIYPMLFKKKIPIDVNTPYIISIEREITDNGFYFWVNGTTDNCSQQLKDSTLRDFVISRTSDSFGNGDNGDIPEIYFTSDRC